MTGSSDYLRNQALWNGGLSAIERIGAEIVHDVRVDPDVPMLSFRQGAAACSYWVDEQSILALRDVADRDAPVVELTLDGGEGASQTILLAPDERRGSGRWGAARIIRLDRIVGADEGAAYQSFLLQVSAVLADL